MHIAQKRVCPALSPGDKTPNQSLWSPQADDGGSHLERPLSKVSITGLNIVLCREAHWLRRLLWLLALVALLVWVIVQLMVPIGRLASGGTTWQFFRRKQDTIGLPALTICHNNKFNKTAMEQMSVPGVSLHDWLADDTRPFSLLDWDRFNLDQFFETAGYTWDGMVSQCQIEKRSCADIGTVRTVQSPLLGQCATLITNVSVQASLLSSQVKIALAENGSFGEHEHDGWTLFMHQNDIVFNDFVLHIGLAQPVKLFANSSITVKVDTNMNLLQANTGKCGEATAPEHQTCLERCIFDHANLTTTLCHIPWIEPSADQPPCTTYDDFVSSGLRLPNSFNELKMSEALKLCPCTQPCSWLEFMISTPYRIAVSETRGVLAERRPSAGQVVTQLELWFSTTVQTTEETEVYPASRFLAEVGGSLGLIIGASLPTIAETIDLLACLCYRVGKRRWAVQ